LAVQHAKMLRIRCGVSMCCRLVVSHVVRQIEAVGAGLSLKRYLAQKAVLCPGFKRTDIN